MTKSQLFLFDDFRKNQSINSKLPAKIVDYEKKIGSLKEKTLIDLDLYKNYVGLFDRLDFRKPEMDVPFPFDWDLFLQLAAASFSCKSSLTLSNNRDQNLPDLHLSVSSNKDEHKVLANLSFFQLERLFLIFVDELLALEIHRNSDSNSANEIEETRQQKLVEWNMGIAQFKPLLLLRQNYGL